MFSLFVLSFCDLPAATWETHSGRSLSARQATSLTDGPGEEGVTDVMTLLVSVSLPLNCAACQSVSQLRRQDVSSFSPRRRAIHISPESDPAAAFDRRIGGDGRRKPHNVTAAGGGNILTAALTAPPTLSPLGSAEKGRRSSDINVKHLAQERLQPWEATWTH